MMAFAAQPYYARFVEALVKMHPEVVPGTSQLLRYPDGELSTAIRQGVEGQDCLVIGTIAPPDRQMLETLLLVEALKRNGARLVWLLLPYLAYSRQDKFMPGLGGGIAAVGSLLRAVGVDGLVTLDLHSQLDTKLLGLPVKSLLPDSIFVREIQHLGWPDATFVAPDEGAIARCEAMAEAIGDHSTVVHLVKQRNSLVHMQIVGTVSPRAVIIDDILDSGRTLVSACNLLHQNGVKEIAVAVTHGLFVGSIWKELFDLGIRALLVSDSCPSALRTELADIKVLSIKPLLPMILAAIRKESHNAFVTP